jgi:ABC-2 type transport system ATP-binding protein
MSEVEALADRVSIIRQGRVVQTGTLDALRGQTRITITARLARSPSDVGSLGVLHDVRLEGGHRLTATVDRSQVNTAMAELIRYDLSDLTVSPASLEDLFLRHYASPGTESDGDVVRNEAHP